MNYWQVGAGDGRRDYSSVFLRFGCMLIGPGQYGDYYENSEVYRDEKFLVKSDISAMRAFAQEVKEGDIVVIKKPIDLRKGQYQVIAVGTVRGDYRYETRFDDVEGWDLSHRRPMNWHCPEEGTGVITGLSRGTFKGVKKKGTIESVNQLLKNSIPASTDPNPEKQELLTDDQLIEILINHGLRSRDAHDFTQTINHIRRLVKWYNTHGNQVKEHETRTFLIIPLLMALGWPEQKLKIEWNNIDIAFFKEIYTKENQASNDCIIILESKRLWDGLSVATKQGLNYAKDYPNCKKMIVSDGCCYKLFERKGKHWSYTAYLNILKPRLKHPYGDNVGGAPDVFLSLMGK